MASDLVAQIHALANWLNGSADPRDMRCRDVLREAAATVARLEGALREHGKHPASCPKGVGVGYYRPPGDAVCNCGIDAALAGKEGDRAE
jgi:hypothetical protein